MIRPATNRDAAAILAIWNPMIRDTLVTFNAAEKTEAELCALIAERNAAGHRFLVAEEAGEILGFASYSQFRGGIGYRRTMEHTILLGPAARGRGIGRALMTAVEDHARAAGAHSIFAGVSGGNPEGRAFHAAMGYREVAVLPEVGFKFGRIHDLVLMQKILS
ncbi:GNAT family N-acetyltransferase [Cereibacter changlensis JA139]|uniref:GNAT family N-acetyltransferase n=2 Tax=Cereibacter changlensis TaxID=402884 RepID=A0A2T4JY87_9RHOB|nr:GNAT family N-acetyltransferase [Cereibacter changlensis]PTE22878.1 GNAT family N-acetyltransferase [Cereibacter changlensis JA139]PZX55298.1 phosphinothricin acetyltransferase [Cereibacter changlensis]